MGRVVHFRRKLLKDGRVSTWCARRVLLVESSTLIVEVDCQQCRLSYDEDRENLLIVQRARRVNSRKTIEVVD